MAYNGTTDQTKANKVLNEGGGGDSGNDSLITNGSQQDSVSSVTPTTTTTSSDTSDDDGDVKSIFLCEFHAVAGPRITLQVPNDYVDKELFRRVHQYIIPKVPLQGSFLSISMFQIKILGYPIRLENENYARNAFYFNLCFVFPPPTRTITYEPVVKKLTEYLISLEKSENILSQINLPGNRERLQKILTRVRADINREKVCILQEGWTTVPLCVVTHYPDEITLGAHQAPVLLENFYRFKRDQWDLATLRIVAYINGFNHVHRIAELATMALELVKECIKHLLVYGVIVMVPVFQYNNMYRPTPKLAQLAKCPKMQARCIGKCSLRHRVCNVKDVFRMFASMAHGASFGEICVRFNPASLNINDRQMVLFGIVEGLIRIVNKYPISVNRNLFVDTNCFAANDDDEDTAAAPDTPSIFNSFGQDEIYPYPLVQGSSSSSNAQVVGGGGGSSAASSKAIPRSGQELTKQRNLVQIFKRFYSYYDHHPKEKTTDQDHQFFYTGNKSFDEISCAIGFSNHQLDEILSRDKHCIVLFK